MKNLKDIKSFKFTTFLDYDKLHYNTEKIDNLKKELIKRQWDFTDNVEIADAILLLYPNEQSVPNEIKNVKKPKLLIMPNYTGKKLEIDSKYMITSIELFSSELIQLLLKKYLDGKLFDRNIYEFVYNKEHEKDYKYAKNNEYRKSWEGDWRVRFALAHIVGEKILDVGCHYGLFSIAFARHGYEVVGVDCSEVAVEECKKNVKEQGFENKVKVIKSFSDNLPFNDNEFDSLWCGDVIEHIPSVILEKSMLEMIRVVKLHGRLLFTISTMSTKPMSVHLRDFDQVSIWKFFEKYNKKLHIVDILEATTDDNTPIRYVIICDKK